MFNRFTRSLTAAFVVVAGLFTVAALTPATADGYYHPYYHHNWYGHYNGYCGTWGCTNNYGYAPPTYEAYPPAYPYYGYQAPVFQFGFGSGWHHHHH